MNEDINLKANQDLDLESKTTLEKILMLQKLLNDLSLRKKAKEKILTEIEKNSFKYLEGRINTKRVFDLILNKGIKIADKYLLIQNSKDCLDDLYQPVYNFYFLLQNDNSLMMKLSELSQKEKGKCEELSDFFVHFLYNNIINSSFHEERLILMIYLHLKKQILDLESINVNYSKESFLFNVIKSLTRKIDIWNFLGYILNKSILKIEQVKYTLTLDINEINQNLNNNINYDKNIFMSSYQPKEKRLKRIKLIDSTIKNKFEKYITNKEFQLKRANKIVDMSNKIHEAEDKKEKKEPKSDNDDYLNLINEFEIINKNDEEEDIKKHEEEFKRRKTEDIELKNNKDNDKKNDIILNFDNKIKLDKKQFSDDANKDEILYKSLQLSKNKSDKPTNDEINKKGKVIIDKFFKDINITKQKLNELLDDYKNIKENNHVYSAMEDYLNKLLETLDNQIIKGSLDTDLIEVNDNEIYSTNFIVNKLILRGKIKNPDTFKKLMKSIYINYKFIKTRINNIIEAISKNIESFPYTIKCLFKIIEILLSKKYNNNYSYLKKYLFKANFLIGNLIIPILQNPNFNGIISKSISDVTHKNLKIICNIFEKIISEELFKRNEDKYLVLFNQFIIESLHKIFDVIKKFDDYLESFKLPNNIKRLLKSLDDDKLQEKYINYDYFKEKPNEIIQFQNLCFSLDNLIIFIALIENNKDALINNNENLEQKNILKEFNEKIKLMDINNINKEEKEHGKIKYFYLSKILYNDKYNKFLEDNSIRKLNENENDLISNYKYYLIQVLGHENFW